MLAGRVVVLALLFVLLAQEPRQLGREGVARRQLLVLLEVELVRPALELLDVRGGVGVGRDGLGHLLGVGLLGLDELGGVDVDRQQPREPVAERARRSGTGGERDVVRHRGPEAGGGNPVAPTGVLQDADDPGRALVPRVLEAEALDEGGIARRSRDRRGACVRHVGQ